MLRKHSFAVLTLSAAGLLATGLFTVMAPVPAQADDHHGGALEAHQHGYEHGYRDGYDYGLETKEHSRPLNFQTDAYKDGDKGYKDYFGKKDEYKLGYREGYKSGAEDAYAGNNKKLEQLFLYTDPNYDPDKTAEDPTVLIYRERHFTYEDVAGDLGYRDGLNAGLKDFRKGDKFNPHDHDAYKNAEHGYDKAYGSKDDFKRAYRQSYETGYRDGFGLPNPRG
jgi:hypothetical protein